MEDQPLYINSEGYEEQLELPLPPVEDYPYPSWP